MKELQKRVERMLKGEKKRREVALKFIEEFEKTLRPMAPKIFRPGDENDIEVDIDNTAVWVWRIKDEKRKSTNLYYRYKRWYGWIPELTEREDEESPGFSFVRENNYGIPAHGEPLECIKGKDFWYCIQLLIEWIPELTKLIDKKKVD